MPKKPTKPRYSRSQLRAIVTHLERAIAGHAATLAGCMAVPAKERPFYIARQIEREKWAIGALRHAIYTAERSCYEHLR